MQFVTVVAPSADVFDGNPAGKPVRLDNAQKVLHLLSIGAGGTGTATITMEKCDNAAGDNAVAIPFKYRKATTDDNFGALTDATSAGITTTAGTNDQYLTEVDARDLSVDKPWVRIKLTEVVNSPVVGVCFAVAADFRYGANPMPTVVA